VFFKCFPLYNAVFESVVLYCMHCIVILLMFYSLFTDPSTYAVPVIGALRGCVVPCLRSMLSKVVPSDKQGMIYCVQISYSQLPHCVCVSDLRCLHVNVVREI